MPLGHEVPQVRRRRPRRAPHQAGQVVLGLRALSGLRLLHLEPAGAPRPARAAAGWAWRRRSARRRARPGPASSAAHEIVVLERRGGRRWRDPSGHRRRRRARRLEAAWALAERGVQVTLHEMRPVRHAPPAHQTDRLAELVCSNSFKSTELTNAHGLLKAELRALGSLLLPVRRRGARARRRRARGGPGASSRGLVHERVTAPSPHHGRARGGHRAAVAGHRRDGTAHLGRALGRSAIVAPRLGRRRRWRFYDAIAPDRAPTSRSTTSRLFRALALRQGRAATTTSTRPIDARGVRRRSSPRCIAADQFTGARVRPGAVLRGLPAGRGDGAARAGDAPLRADEAGRPARSAHRARAVRGGAAAPGGPRGPDVEPGRLPDPAPDSGAAAGVPHDSRARGRRSSCASAASTATRYLNSPAALGPRAHARGTTTALFFAGQLTGVEGYTESLGTGLLAGINLARRLGGRRAARPAARPRCWAGSTAICARPTRRTSSR